MLLIVINFLFNCLNIIIYYFLIILYKDGIGRYDSKNNLTNEFRSKEDCCLFLKMSDRTLRKALETKQLYNNYYYKGLGCKMKI